MLFAPCGSDLSIIRVARADRFCYRFENLLKPTQSLCVSFRTFRTFRNGSVAAQAVSGNIEDALWLVPIEDRQRRGSLRKGIVEGFTLGQYLLLVDYTSRVVRKGKSVVSSELAGIFERLQSSAEIWSQRIKRLHEKSWVGRFLSASRDRLRELASKLGVRHLANIG